MSVCEKWFRDLPCLPTRVDCVESTVEAHPWFAVVNGSVKVVGLGFAKGGISVCSLVDEYLLATLSMWFGTDSSECLLLHV